MLISDYSFNKKKERDQDFVKCITKFKSKFPQHNLSPFKIISSSLNSRLHVNAKPIRNKKVTKLLNLEPKHSIDLKFKSGNVAQTQFNEQQRNKKKIIQ